MYIKIGKVAGTHGIKGEVRIKSDFEYKKEIFIKGFHLYFGESYEPFIIETYRHHKEYDMVTSLKYNNINDVLKYRSMNVYIMEDDLNLSDNQVLISELISYNAYFNNDYCGKVIDFVYNNVNNLLIIKNEEEYYIPYQEYFIEKIDKNEKKIHLRNVKELIK